MWTWFTACLISAVFFKKACWGGGGGRGYGRQYCLRVRINIVSLTTKFSFSSG